MSQRNGESKALVQFCNLGNLDDVMVNGQRFAFEDARVVRVYASWEDRCPSCLRAEWGNVLWVDPKADDENYPCLRLTVPACFIDSAPITDRRQPAAVTWADMIERALIEMAEKVGGEVLMETTSLEIRGTQIDQTAKGLEILNAPEYETAGEILKTIKALRGQIAETFDPIIKKAHQTHKEALQAKGKHEAPLDHAEKTIKAKMLVYVEKERARAEAEKRALEAAERARIEDERLKTAQEFTDAGLPDEADRFMEAPVIVHPANVEAEGRLEGVHTTERKTAEVVDFLALVRSVALGNTPSDCLAPIPAVLNAWARDGWAPPGVDIGIARSVVVKG